MGGDAISDIYVRRLLFFGLPSLFLLFCVGNALGFPENLWWLAIYNNSSV